MLGDVVCNQAAGQVAKALQETAVVVSVPIQPGEVRNSSTVLADVDRLLGSGPWDVISFNVGLGDLVYRAPDRHDFRSMAKGAGGVRVTDRVTYAKNLDALVKRLRTTGAALVWVSTTPIQSSSNGIFDPGSEVEYNAIAARVMKDHDVEVNDLHAFVLARVAEQSEETGKPVTLTSPFLFDVARRVTIPLHEPIAERITEVLRGRR